MNFFLIQLPVWHPFLKEGFPHLALAIPMGDGGDGADIPLADRVAVLHGPRQEQDLLLRFSAVPLAGAPPPARPKKDLRGFRSQTRRVQREPQRDCRGTENPQGCVEAWNCLRNGQKRQNPEGVTRRGSALTKNRTNWRIEIWLAARNPIHNHSSHHMQHLTL